MDVSMTDKVSDIARRIPNNACCIRQDMYVMCKGRVLRWSDELRSSAVSDGCTLNVLKMMRGGGKHRNKKNKAEKNPAESLKSQEPVRDQQEHDKETIIQKSELVQGQQEPKKDKSLLSRKSADDRDSEDYRGLGERK